MQTCAYRITAMFNRQIALLGLSFVTQTGRGHMLCSRWLPAPTYARICTLALHARNGELLACTATQRKGSIGPCLTVSAGDVRPCQLLATCCAHLCMAHHCCCSACFAALPSSFTAWTAPPTPDVIVECGSPICMADGSGAALKPGGNANACWQPRRRNN
ncbi:hypothetical protein COO60DRAFT_1505101 [Scenedesmus sp. NREL 46B-D3]|nr:hypothetical protein COO60DRAFT_1505101 [Scenedesmus sp. NREL 46B-D3]